MQSSVDSTVPMLRGISSMATRLLLTELADTYRVATGIAVQLESVGGVDAAKRVQAGEVFDAVFLASDAIDKLLAAGQLAARQPGRPRALRRGCGRASGCTGA